MKTDVIMISGSEDRIDAALREAEKMAVYKELSHKNTIHLRLLTEEMMGMVRSITGDAEGRFWIEDESGEYQLHLLLTARLSKEKRKMLLSTSSTGRNESTASLTGRVRSFLEWCISPEPSVLDSSLLFREGMQKSDLPAVDWEWSEWSEWSLRRYEGSLFSGRQNFPGGQEAWDELEKSVVAHVADDVKVAIQGETVEVIIIRKMM